MELVPVNAEALKRAMETVSGPEVAALTLKAYAAIDAAMKYGHELGAELAQAALAKAYDEGFDVGEAAAMDAAAQVAYDDGYVDGVDDARHDPEEADDYIAYLCSLDVAGEEFDELQPKQNAHVEGEAYNGSNVSDSGDEQPDLSGCAGFWDDRYSGA